MLVLYRRLRCLHEGLCSTEVSDLVFVGVRHKRPIRRRSPPISLRETTYFATALGVIKCGVRAEIEPLLIGGGDGRRSERRPPKRPPLRAGASLKHNDMPMERRAHGNPHPILPNVHRAAVDPRPLHQHDLAHALCRHSRDLSGRSPKLLHCERCQWSCVSDARALNGDRASPEPFWRSRHAVPALLTASSSRKKATKLRRIWPNVR